MNSATQDRQCHRNPPHRRGFTLTEMLVVIVILLILLGIGVTVGTAIIQEQEVQMTREVVKQCELIAAEYQTLTGGVPSPQNGADGAFDGNTNNKVEIREFVIVTEVDLKEMYKNFDTDFYRDGRIYDAWGKELKYSHDGITNRAGNRKHNTYYFASAGPDDQWGNVERSQKDHRDFIRSTDNIYSMDVGNN